jgi:oxygen-independent coproporphyrinogen-3 oxidase
MAGIYIHIPFCRQACHYCDFHFSTNRKIELEMITAIEKELELRKDYIHNEHITTIYFGGGTPSLLANDSLNRILNKVNSLFKMATLPEISLEANPDDLTADKLLFLKSIGINRLSVGIQTFNDALLRYLNRAHNRSQAVASVALAREAGFTNISVDLIYAIPGQHADLWKSDIDNALELNPEHISGYCLTIEDKTAFGNWLKAGKLEPVPDESAAAYLYMLMDTLAKHGYEQYEISNFAKQGYRSRHNSSYWRQEYYLGVGPGAHSYSGSSRQANISNNYLYVKAIMEGRIPAQTEQLSREEKINEYILTTLRTAWGTDTAMLKANFGYDLLSRNRDLLNNLVANGFVTLTHGVIHLTQSGKLFADKIAADFFEIES